MGRLYLMRHGETAFNRQMRTQGWCDSPLTPDGIAQAKRAAATIRRLGLTFDHFCCSTQERASDTLEIVMRELYGKVLPYDRMKGLKESFYGEYEAALLPMLVKSFERDRDAFVPFGGEPYQVLMDRMHDTLGYVMSQPGRESVLAVAHMRCSIAFIESVTGEEISYDRLTNCCISVFGYEDGAFSFEGIIDAASEQAAEEAVGA